MNACAIVATLTLQLCGYQPSPAVCQKVYSVAIYAPKAGHEHYVATAMCEAIERANRPSVYGMEQGACPRVNNVCLR